MSTLLASALDIHAWLSADNETPDTERIQRDRQIGAALDTGDDVERVLAWWETVDTATSDLGRRTVGVTRWISAGLGATGLIVGSTTAGVALAYDGEYPVNLLALLGVCVALPGVLLLITLVMCAARGSGWTSLARGLSVLNLNRVVVGLWQRLTGIHVVGGGWDRVLHWQLVVFSQWFAIAFFVGLLATLLVLVAVTDLAFGWSTTLNLDARWIADVLSALAWPWSGIVPTAVPDLALVELSRYYRLEDQAVVDASRLGAWWPFVALCILVWGLLPRIGFAGVAQQRQRAAERSYLREHPEVTALLHRLAQPAAGFAEETAAAAEETDGEVSWNAAPQTSGACIVWDDAGHVEGAVRASSAMDSASRTRAIVDLPAGDVRVLTKGYEPPMLAFHDFLTELRERIGQEGAIVVMPLGLDGGPASSADLDIWRQSLASLRDMRLYVSGEER